MASEDHRGFVVDGEERIRSDERKRIEAPVVAKYAAELAQAGRIRRWILRWHMRCEVRAELKRVAPSRETLYGMSRMQ